MKKILAIMLVVLLALSFAGCGNGGNSENEIAGYEILDGGVLKDMEACNNFESIMEKYGKITMYATDRTGGEYYIHLEKTEDGYNHYLGDATGVESAITPEGQFILTSDGDGQYYIFQNDEERETIEAGAIESVRGSMYKFNETEQVVGDETEGDKRTVTTAVHMTDEIEGYLEFKSAWGIEDEEFDFFNDYVLDVETLEILENRTYCVLSTGRVDSGKVTITYGQEHTVSDAMKAYMEEVQ